MTILDELDDALEDRDRAIDNLYRVVQKARKNGLSWEKISHRLGISAEAARVRYSKDSKVGRLTYHRDRGTF